MESIEIYKCNECGSMNAAYDGDVSHSDCKNCNSTDIAWYVGVRVCNADEMEAAQKALSSDVVRTNKEITDLYERADGVASACVTDHTAAQVIVELIDWLTDPKAPEPEYNEEGDEERNDA